MANKRMFSMDIVDTDAFLDMPSSSQALYFHLAMRADDDGFVGSPKKILKICGASEDDYKVLSMKRFIIPFDKGVCVIKHWKIHNYLRKDTYKETQYRDEKALLIEKENGAYTEAVNVPSTFRDEPVAQIREGKVSTDKISTEKETLTFGEYQKVKLSQKSYEQLLADLGEQPTSTLITELDQYIASKGKDPYKNHAATIKAWFRRRLQEHASQLKNTKPKMI